MDALSKKKNNKVLFKKTKNEILLPAKRTVGIDIGSKNIKMAAVKGNMLLSVATEPLPNGIISDGNIEAIDLLAKSVKACKRKLKGGVSHAVLCLSGKDLILREIKLPQMKEEQVMDNIMSELSNIYLLASGDYITDYRVLDIINDEFTGEKSMRVLVVSTPKVLVADYYKVCRKAGIKLERIDVFPNAHTKMIRKLMNDQNEEGQKKSRKKDKNDAEDREKALLEAEKQRRIEEKRKELEAAIKEVQQKEREEQLKEKEEERRRIAEEKKRQAEEREAKLLEKKRLEEEEARRREEMFAKRREEKAEAIREARLRAKQRAEEAAMKTAEKEKERLAIAAESNQNRFGWYFGQELDDFELGMYDSREEEKAVETAYATEPETVSEVASEVTSEENTSDFTYDDAEFSEEFNFFDEPLSKENNDTAVETHDNFGIDPEEDAIAKALASFEDIDQNSFFGNIENAINGNEKEIISYSVSLPSYIIGDMITKDTDNEDSEKTDELTESQDSYVEAAETAVEPTDPENDTDMETENDEVFVYDDPETFEQNFADGVNSIGNDLPEDGESGNLLQNVCLVDIGSSTSNVTFVKNGSYSMHKVIRYGGEYINEAIAEKLDIDVISAENMKNSQSDEAMSVLYEYYDSIISELDNTMYYYKSINNQKGVDCLVVAGGSSRLTGIKEYFSKQLNVPVFMLSEVTSIDYSKRIRKQQLSGKPIHFEDYLSAVSITIKEEWL